MRAQNCNTTRHLLGPASIWTRAASHPTVTRCARHGPGGYCRTNGNQDTTACMPLAQKTTHEGQAKSTVGRVRSTPMGLTKTHASEANSLGRTRRHRPREGLARPPLPREAAPPGLKRNAPGAMCDCVFPRVTRAPAPRRSVCRPKLSTLVIKGRQPSTASKAKPKTFLFGARRPDQRYAPPRTSSTTSPTSPCHCAMDSDFTKARAVRRYPFLVLCGNPSRLNIWEEDRRTINRASP